MATASDQIVLAILIHVVGDDRDAGIAERQFRVVGPGLLKGLLRRLQPAQVHDQVAAPVAVHVAKSQSVSLGLRIHIHALERARALSGSVPLQNEDSNTVVRQVWHRLHMAVAVDIPEAAPLHVAHFRDFVDGPFHRLALGIFPPDDLFIEPAARNHVQEAIAVHIQGIIREVVEILGFRIDLSHQMGNGEIRAGVPVLAADNIHAAVVVHIEEGAGLIGPGTDPLFLEAEAASPRRATAATAGRKRAFVMVKLLPAPGARPAVRFKFRVNAVECHDQPVPGALSSCLRGTDSRSGVGVAGLRHREKAWLPREFERLCVGRSQGAPLKFLA